MHNFISTADCSRITTEKNIKKVMRRQNFNSKIHHQDTEENFYDMKQKNICK